MKKILLHILILVAIVGLFSPFRFSLAINCVAPQVPSSDGTSCTDVLGTCRQGTDGQPQDKITQKDCESKNTGLSSSDKKWIWISYYYTLAPLPCDPGTPGCGDSNQLNTFDPSQNGNLSNYLNLMIKLFIGICAVLAVIMIVIGGIEYMTTELISGKEAGKERIINAILGLLLALGAWTLLYTINPNLLNSKLDSLTSVTVDVQSADIPQATPPPGGKYADGSVVGTPWQPNIVATTLPSGVTVNHGGAECATVGQQNCTSTKGLDLSIVNAIKSDCPSCQLVITGGTESWLHSAGSSHKPGSSTVDLGATTDLNNEITGSGSFPKDGSIYEDKTKGICYFAEGAGNTANTTGNHWHAYKC